MPVPPFAAAIPATKMVANSNNPGCSSSSSDEELVVADNGGWPSVVSVLETPDRRRMRKSLRSTKRTVSLGPGSSSSSAYSSSKFSISSPSIRQKRNANGEFSASTFFNSPPANNRMSSKQQFSSPTLRTPSQSSAIHLSRSPLCSFFIKGRRQKGEGVGVDASPKSSQSSASSSFTVSAQFAQYENEQPVLKPLNLHNYIGIRFCGEQPEQMSRNQLMDGQNGKMTDENKFGEQKMRKGRISQDSGFFESNSSFNSATTIETPSKGLITSRHQPSCSSSSASSCPFSNSSISLLNSAPSSANSGPLQFSPTNRSFFPTPLLPEFGHNSECSLNSSSSPLFHSPIPEQSFGPLEASVVHGILDDWDKLQPNLLATTAVVQEPSKSPPKTPGGNRQWNIRKPSPRSQNFERKLQILRRKRESPRKKGGMGGGELWRNGKRRQKGIPRELFVEGLEQIYGQGWGDEEFTKMFPKLDIGQFKSMFGQTMDQLEITKQAHAFLHKQREKIKNEMGGHTKSAGLPPKLENERRINLE